MGSQRGPLSEEPMADFTFNWLLTGVHQSVFPTRTGQPKPLLADVTLVFLFARVHHHMLVETVRRFELLGTHFTLVERGGVFVDLVGAQVRPRVERERTQVTEIVSNADIVAQFVILHY